MGGRRLPLGMRKQAEEKNRCACFWHRPKLPFNLRHLGAWPNRFWPAKITDKK